MSMTKATWSELHTDLVNLILQRIDNDLDLIRFRSVCSKWRHSSISNHNLIHALPFTLPNSSNSSKVAMYSTSISKHTLLLLKPQQQQETFSPWLISITKNSDGKTQLCNPLQSLSSYRIHYHDLDLDKYSVIHLGNCFAITSRLSHKRSLYEYLYSSYLYSSLERKNFEAKGTKIVSVMCNGKKPIALGLLNHKGHPTLFNLHKQSWTVVPPDISTYFQDICVFKNRFIVVNKIGRTFAIGPDYSMELVAEYVEGGEMKFLVESEGELLLVDIYDRHCFGFPGEDGLKLDVLRLEENEKRWVKLTSLGDRVLILGNKCLFSASLDKGGNCVVFIDGAFLPFDNMHCGECVFHLGEGRLTPLSENPYFSNLFWPPPEWIVKRCGYEKEASNRMKEDARLTWQYDNYI